MWNTKVRAVFLIFLMMGILSLTYSLPTSTVVISSTGKISPNYTVNATSGSPTDIQNAINSVISHGGGTVYIPAGTFTFNPPMNGIGVTIPFTTVSINIIGAGIGVTVLQETVNSGSSSMFAHPWSGQNYNGSAVRISGISFVGFVLNETVTNNNAIYLACTQDFRIDHNSFQNFAEAAIGVDDDTGGTYHLVDRGVIDHNTFDNPYKDTVDSVWGYGIIIYGDYYTWDPNIADYLGHYYPTTTVSGGVVPQPTYIENNNFTRCRHAISSNAAGYYVVRYNHFEKPAPYRPVDVHGSTGNPAQFGGRGLEAYGNIFDLTNLTYTNGDCAAFGLRGGGGVIWNNTIIVPNGGAHDNLGLQLGNDGETAYSAINSLYWWNNTVERQDGTIISPSAYIQLNYPYVENVNYFLRAPNQATDGFAYTAFTYPHPIVTS